MKTTAHPYFEFRPGIFEVDEFDCGSVFVIVGETSALLIDCGTGIGDLKQVVCGKITGKPLIVAASHAHSDHVGGAYQFDEIYIHKADLEDAAKAPSVEGRKAYAALIKRREGKYYAYDPETDITAPDWKPLWRSMEDGKVFDLGNRRVIAYHVPGHTKGEMVFLDENTRTLLCADACNCNWYLGNLGGTPRENLQKAYEGLKRIYDMQDQYDYVINSHHDYRGFGQPLGSDVLPDLVSCMKEVLDGTAEFKEVKDPMSKTGGTRISAVHGNVQVSTFGSPRIDEI